MLPCIRTAAARSQRVSQTRSGESDATPICIRWHQTTPDREFQFIHPNISTQRKVTQSTVQTQRTTRNNVTNVNQIACNRRNSDQREALETGKKAPREISPYKILGVDFGFLVFLLVDETETRCFEVVAILVLAAYL